jgi:ABC-type transporter Mla subunit MlaD
MAFNYGGTINTAGFGQSALDQEEEDYLLANTNKLSQYAKTLKDLGIDSNIAGLYALTKLEKPNTKKQLEEILGILGPYQKEVARENQRLGMESALFANFLDMPNKFSRAMAAQHYYVPETLQAISQTVGRPSSFFTPRQYVSL